MSAIIGRLINSQRRRAFTAAPHRRSALQASDPLPAFYPVANSVLSQILKLSLSNVSHCKSKANKLGYIEMKTNLNDTGVDYKQAGEYMKANPEDQQRIRIVDHKIMIQQPNQIKCNLTYTNRKKNETYYRRYSSNI